MGETGCGIYGDLLLYLHTTSTNYAATNRYVLEVQMGTVSQQGHWTTLIRILDYITVFPPGNSLF